jgi:hypothetical protein
MVGRLSIGKRDPWLNLDDDICLQPQERQELAWILKLTVCTLV